MRRRRPRSKHLRDMRSKIEQFPPGTLAGNCPHFLDKYLYRSEHFATARAAELNAAQAADARPVIPFRCTHCGHWHVGRRRQ